MSTAPESLAQPPPPILPSRRRTFFYVGIGLLALIIVAAVAIVYYFRSGRVNLYLISEIQAAVQDYGLRADIGRLDIGWRTQTATVHDVKIYNKQTNELIASVQTVILTADVQHPFALRLRRDVIFKQLNLDGLDLYYVNDPKGKSTLRGLHSPPPAAPSRITFDYSKLVGEVSNGTVHFDDKQLNIQTMLQNFHAGVSPFPAADGPGVIAALKSTGGSFGYEGRTTDINALEVDFRLSDNDIDVKNITLNSKAANATITGKVTNIKNQNYDLNVQAQAALGELTRVFAPEANVAGDAGFTGKLTGTGAQYQLNGNLTSKDISASGARLRGLRADDISIKPEGNNIAFTSKDLRADAATVDTTHINGMVVNAVRGSFDNGRLEIRTPQATISRVNLAQGRVNGIALRNIQATLDNGTHRLTGDLGIQSAAFAQAQLGQTRGKLTADNNTVVLNNFTAGLLGGSATGTLTAKLKRVNAIHVAANFNNLATHEIFKLVAKDDAPLSGVVNGNADLSFSASNVQRLSGTVNAQFVGQTTQTANAIPVNGNLALKATNGIFDISDLRLTTGVTTIAASGRLSPTGDSNLNFSVTSTNSQQVATIINSLTFLPPVVADLKPTLAGDLNIQGIMAGRLDNPTITADLNAASVGVNDALLGSLSLHLLFSPAEIRVDNGLLTQPTGGKVTFNFATPMDMTATTGKLDATFQQLDLTALMSALPLPQPQTAITGALNGDAHLTNLPGSPQGAINLNLANGTVAGQAINSAQARISFNGETARLETIDLQLPQGRLIADGTLGLKTSDFQFKGRAENVDLARLVASFSSDPPAITGTAIADFKATGNIDNIEQLNVELNAVGQNVSIAGRSAGELKATARTTPDGKINLDVVTGITGAPQTITASLDVRAPGIPVAVSSDLKNLDIEQVLSIVAPSVANTIAGNITATLRINGPIYNEADELSIDRLQGGLSLTNVSLRASGTPININTPVTVRLRGPEVTVDQIHVSGQGANLLLGGTIGLKAGAPMNFSLTGTADLSLISASATSMSAQGKVDLDARLAGTVSDPKLSGAIILRDGSFNSPDLPVDIVNAEAHVTLAGDRITLDSFTANANDGTLNSSGSITLGQLFQPSAWSFKLQASAVDVYYQGASVMAEGTLTFAGSPQGQTISGTITIPEGQYLSNFDLSGLAASGGGGTSFDLGLSGASGSSTMVLGVPVNLDVNITANESLLVRNNTVNTVASALLHVGGTLGNTDVSGRISLDGGKIKFRDQQYDITTGTLTLPGGPGSVPIVNLNAESTVSGYQVYVGIEGPLNDLDLNLNSDPQLTRAEVLSLIATGRTDTGTTTGDSLVQTGISSAASLLTSELLFNPIGEQAQQLFGLNKFQIDPLIRPNTNPAARLTIGRQIARDFAFAYSTNLGSEQDQVISLEYNISNRFSAVTAYSQGGTQATQTTNDSIFTFDVRGRKRFALGGDFSAGLPPAGVPPNFAKVVRPPAEVAVEKPTDIKIKGKDEKNLLPIETDGYSRALMRLGEVNLKNYLQQQGYFFAQVTSRCQPVNCTGPGLKLIYDVRPDKRYDLNKVNIEGADMLNISELKGRLQTKPASFLGSVPLLSNLPLIGGLARGITSTDRLRNDRETIRKAMADAGYRAARVTSRMGIAVNADDLMVTFSVEPGPLSTIAEIAVDGASVLREDEVREEIPVTKGQPFSLTSARQGAQQINTLYAQNGYLDVTTDLTLEDLPDNQVRLHYTIKEGEKAVVREIDITGQTLTKENAIKQFLAFQAGDVLTPQLIRRSQRDLYATGAFREVNITPEKIADQGSERRVLVKVTEAKPLLLTYGLGYSSDVGPRGLLELTHSNLFGRANSGTIRISGSGREELVQFIYNDPRPFGTKWPLTLSAFYDRNSNVRAFVPRRLVNGQVEQGTSGQSFGVDRFAAYAQVEHRLGEFSSVRFRYNLEQVSLFDIQNIPILEISRNQQAIRLGDLSAGFTRDTRNSVVDPEKGKLFSADYTFASNFLGGNESFNKLFGQFQAYHKFPTNMRVLGDSVFAFAARIGLANQFKFTDRNGDGIISEPETLLPISERFFAGGVTTLRGFRFEEAGPQAVLEPTNANELPTLVPIGGNALTIFNFELRIPIYGPLRLVPFYDLGNVFRRTSDISFGGMTNTIGVGLRFKTPVGPIGVDFGHLLDPPVFFSATGIQLRPSTNVFHIRFGQTF